MKDTWPRMVAALLLLSGCSGTPTTAPAKTTAGKSTSTTRTGTTTTSGNTKTTGGTSVTASGGGEVVAPVTMPEREGHALQSAGIKPEAGVTVKVSGTGSDVSMNYTPDPPEVDVLLSVPDTSLGCKVDSVHVSYLADDKPTALPDDPPLPVPEQFVVPGSPFTFHVLVGSVRLRQLFADPAKQPGSLTAVVTFVDDSGSQVMDTSGKPLEVDVPLQLQ